MAATPAQIREAIRLALATAFEPDVQVSAYRLASPMTACLQVIGTDEAEYDQTMQRGVDRWVFQVQALAGSPIDIVAQTLLDTWKAPAGASSVKTVLESDPTLGGVVQAVNVPRASGDMVYEHRSRVEGNLGCIFTVTVWNTGH